VDTNKEKEQSEQEKTDKEIEDCYINYNII